MKVGPCSGERQARQATHDPAWLRVVDDVPRQLHDQVLMVVNQVAKEDPLARQRANGVMKGRRLLVVRRAGAQAAQLSWLTW